MGSMTAVKIFLSGLEPKRFLIGLLESEPFKIDLGEPFSTLLGEPGRGVVGDDRLDFELEDEELELEGELELDDELELDEVTTSYPSESFLVISAPRNVLCWYIMLLFRRWKLSCRVIEVVSSFMIQDPFFKQNN
jgi:hypothetical protein